MTKGAPVVVVLGMHRSGTSVGMGVLRALGVACGDDLVPAGRSNPAGFWEHAGIVAVHERLLADLGRVWHGPQGTHPLPEGWEDSEAALRATQDLAEIVRKEREAVPGQVWGFKDPRTMRLWPLWQRIWDELALEPVPIVMFRHPDAVVRSLRKHNGLDPERGQLIWLQHNLEALRATGSTLRAALEFDALVNDPEAEVGRLATAISDVVAPSPAAIQTAVGTVSADLRSHGAAAPPANRLVAETYELLRATAAGGADAGAIEALGTRYDAAADLFSCWRDDRRNALSDWAVRFLVSRTAGQRP